MQFSPKLKLAYKMAACAKTLEQVIFDVTNLIINNTPQSLHKHILNKVESLNFDVHDMGQSSEYEHKNNTVYINMNHVGDANVYLHEMMHAIGTAVKQYAVNIGLNQRFLFKLNNESKLVINLGYGANEGLNQHYTEQFIKDYAEISPVSVEYSYCANLMSNLEKLLNEDDLKKAHFSGAGLPALISLVQKECNLPNANKILKFILQLDAFKTIARTHIVFGATYSADMRYSLVAAYKTLITIALMKAKSENKNIYFADVIDLKHLDGDNATYFNKYILSDLMVYFYQEKEHINHEQLSTFRGLTYQDLFKNTYHIFSNYIKNSSFQGSSIPEELKCGEFYNFILLNGSIADENGESKLIFTSDFQKDLTIAIFKQDNNMLPDNIKETTQLITQILSSRTVVRSGAQIDDLYIFEATEDEDFNKYLMDTMPDYYRDNFENISYMAKTNVTLVDKMLREIFLQKSQLYKFKKMMSQQILENDEIEQLFIKHNVDKKLEIKTNQEK